jgi:hypothetical protein
MDYNSSLLLILIMFASIAFAILIIVKTLREIFKKKSQELLGLFIIITILLIFLISLVMGLLKYI